jgi:hypothetical protein
MERHSSSLSVSTTRGGQQAFDSEAFSSITPPNFGSGKLFFADTGGTARRTRLAGGLLGRSS